MFKKLIFTLALLMPTFAFAEKNWQLVADDDFNTIYIDTNSIEAVVNHDLYRINERRLTKTPMPIYEREIGDIDFSSEYIDCKNQYYGIFMNTTFDKDMNIKFYTTTIPLENVDMYPFLPNSTGNKIQDFICNSRIKVKK